MAANNLVINLPRVYNEVLLEELEPGELFMFPFKNDVVYMKTNPIVCTDSICYNAVNIHNGCQHGINEDHYVIRIKGVLDLELMN